MKIERIRSSAPLRVRTAWISDVHLGFKGCQAEFLLDFLRHLECEQLYLVGDIIDIWAMRGGLYWPQSHNDVIRTILGKAKHHTTITYIPGNHDETLREYIGLTFGEVMIRRDAIHKTVDGRRLLVLHGDEFDGVVQCSRFLAMLGSSAYGWLLKANSLINRVRRWSGRPYWSLAAYLKHQVKNAVTFIGQYETAVVRRARQAKVDGVVCGHIHRAEITTMEDLLYLNTGDWVESCTALVEHQDGALELIHWSDLRYAIKGERGVGEESGAGLLRPAA